MSAWVDAVSPMNYEKDLASYTSPREELGGHARVDAFHYRDHVRQTGCVAGTGAGGAGGGSTLPRCIQFPV